MANILQSIDYKNIFTYFEEISNVPRGSYHNEKISDYLVSFAQKHGLEHYQDKLGNVIIIKEATPGYENAPAVILQGHMDMVCEKESGVEHDFQTEGLKLRVVTGEVPEDAYIEAEGTTLGGDDGIAMAYALAILAGDDYKPPLFPSEPPSSPTNARLKFQRKVCQEVCTRLCGITCIVHTIAWRSMIF